MNVRNDLQKAVAGLEEARKGRDDAIRAAAAGGLSTRVIAGATGLSRQRIHQILNPTQPKRRTDMASGDSYPKYANNDPTFAQATYDDGTDKLRQVMEVVGAHAPSRLRYQDVGDELGWSYHQLPGVFAGYWRNQNHRARPWHIAHPDDAESGAWEIWMEEESAGAVLDAARSKEQIDGSAQKRAAR
jgi:hypothetical protein